MKQRKLVSITILSILISVMVTSLAWAALGDNVRNLSQSEKFGTSVGAPAIALSQNESNQNNQNLGVVWVERRTGGDAIQGPIYFRGGTLGENNKGFYRPKVIVDNSNTQTDQSLQPAIASDPTTAGDMHVVWVNLQSSTNRILHKRCTITPNATQCDTGETLVASSSNELANPAIVANPFGATAGVHVVWDQVSDSNTRLINYRGRDNNDAWQAAEEVSGIGSADRRAFQADIATSTINGTTYVHVVWVEDTNPNNGLEINNEVKYRRGMVGSNGLVTAWDSIIQLYQRTDNSGDVKDPDYPSVAAVGDTVVVLWDLVDVDQSGHYHAVYTISTNGGESFGTVRDVGSGVNIPGNFTSRRSDAPDTLPEQIERLQLEASFVPSTTVGITGTLHVAWHQSSGSVSLPYHDVRYNSLQIDTTCQDDCTAWSDGVEGVNETDGRKIVESDAYSASPDIVGGTDNNLHIVYMENDTGLDFDLQSTVYDTLFNSTVNLPAVDNPGPVYLPVIFRSS